MGINNKVLSKIINISMICYMAIIIFTGDREPKLYVEQHQKDYEQHQEEIMLPNYAQVDFNEDDMKDMGQQLENMVTEEPTTEPPNNQSEETTLKQEKKTKKKNSKKSSKKKDSGSKGKNTESSNVGGEGANTTNSEETAGNDSEPGTTETDTGTTEDTTEAATEVERKMVSLAYTWMDCDKIKYGDELDASKIEVVGKYNDGTEEAIDIADCTISSFSSDKVGAGTCTLSYGNLTVDMNYTIQNYVVGIEPTCNHIYVRNEVTWDEVIEKYPIYYNMADGSKELVDKSDYNNCDIKFEGKSDCDGMVYWGHTDQHYGQGYGFRLKKNECRAWIEVEVQYDYIEIHSVFEESAYNDTGKIYWGNEGAINSLSQMPWWYKNWPGKGYAIVNCSDVYLIGAYLDEACTQEVKFPLTLHTDGEISDEYLAPRCLGNYYMKFGVKDAEDESVSNENESDESTTEDESDESTTEGDGSASEDGENSDVEDPDDESDDEKDDESVLDEATCENCGDSDCEGCEDAKEDVCADCGFADCECQSDKEDESEDEIEEDEPEDEIEDDEPD